MRISKYSEFLYRPMHIFIQSCGGRFRPMHIRNYSWSPEVDIRSSYKPESSIHSVIMPDTPPLFEVQERASALTPYKRLYWRALNKQYPFHAPVKPNNICPLKLAKFQ